MSKVEFLKPVSWVIFILFVPGVNFVLSYVKTLNENNTKDVFKEVYKMFCIS